MSDDAFDKRFVVCFVGLGELEIHRLGTIWRIERRSSLVTIPSLSESLCKTQDDWLTEQLRIYTYDQQGCNYKTWTRSSVNEGNRKHAEKLGVLLRANVCVYGARSLMLKGMVHVRLKLSFGMIS